MADIKWTKAQIDAIEAGNNRILVSAAAGSGKTAVLVERVVRKLADRENPADIDSFIIITFTISAASQMREKIYKGIRAALKKDPENKHLAKQLLKAGNAKITTIDALCGQIVRENFQDVDIEPGTRIGDQAELAMLKEDCLKSLIEDKYAAGSPEFLEFVDFYMDKSDARLEDIITGMYDFAESHPEPELWIKGSCAAYEYARSLGICENEEEKELSEQGNVWAEYFREYVGSAFKDIESACDRGEKICQQNYGPYKYLDKIESVREFIREITAEDMYFDARKEKLDDFLADWKRLPSVTKKDEVDDSLKAAAQKIINGDIKEKLKALQKTFFACSMSENYEKMAGCSGVAKEIADLTLEFKERFDAAKKSLKIADFSDMEHYALQILCSRDENGRLKKENGSYVPTQTALSMAESISEIIVDEYQDTNQLQECILEVLCSRSDGKSCMFMVGDVKQSIYGFRMACPELFIKKFNEYPEEDGSPCRKILLNANFRSRKEIVDITNYVFSQTMIKEAGGIDYEDGNMLVEGNSEAYPEGGGFTPEFIFTDQGGETGKKLEAYVIAKKIEDLVRDGKVTDKETGQLRPVRYSDITILTRTSGNPEIEQMLTDRGIPVSKISNKGFFETFEIRLIFNLLSITDNPYQDIPFAAVLTSPLYGADANALARLKTEFGGEEFSLYEACKGKNRITEDLEKYRHAARITDTAGLLEYVLKESGLTRILLSMPGGNARLANVEFLKQKAAEYDKTSYMGLPGFLRYMEKIKTGSDFGQAQSFDDVDTVHMMTIHKSKGLEFPVVILAGTGKLYNTSDITDSVIFDREAGLGIELRDPVERIAQPTLPLETIRSKKKSDLYAEEMRLLYVAFTRAKEKLIVTGSTSHLITKDNSYAGLHFADSVKQSAGDVMSCGSHLKILLGTLIRHKDGGALNDLAGIDPDICKKDHAYDPGFNIDVEVFSDTEIETERAEEIIDTAGLKNILTEMAFGREGRDKDLQAGGREGRDNDPQAGGPEDDEYKKIKEYFEFEYLYKKAVVTPVKITASGLEVHSEGSEPGYDSIGTGAAAPQDKVTGENICDDIAEGIDAAASAGGRAGMISYDPDAEEKALKGSERGNAYHLFFELFDYTELENIPEVLQGGNDSELLKIIAEQKSDMEQNGLMSHEYALTVDNDVIACFLKSNTGIRMKDAALKGTLRREQQFVMGIEEDGEMRLIQGIIDAFFEEDENMILVDYKTDKNKDPEYYISTYKLQQDAYRDAIEKALGKPVTEQIIYSTELGREILL